MERYLMIAQDGEHEIVINKSRFICHMKRIYQEQEAKQFITEIKKQHEKANHNCSAYQIGDHHEIQRAHDDGEPCGTAGVPMLEVLRKQDIKNCVVVVTRYFGGIKLGAGGLIRAYGNAVAQGIKTLGIVERKAMMTMFVRGNYSWLGTLQSRLESSHYHLKTIHYSDKITLEILIEVNDQNLFTQWITDLTHGKITLEVGATSFEEIPYVQES